MTPVHTSSSSSSVVAFEKEYGGFPSNVQSNDEDDDYCEILEVPAPVSSSAVVALVTPTASPPGGLPAPPAPTQAGRGGRNFGDLLQALEKRVGVEESGGSWKERMRNLEVEFLAGGEVEGPLQYRLEHFQKMAGV
jgi:hypothetical protein